MTWSAHASQKLDEAGCRSGAARSEVLELLAAEDCALTALEMDGRLAAGRASIYRTLERLEQLHLIQRIDIGAGAAGYERLDPELHHHHFVCDECERVTPFSDQSLERAIHELESKASFEVARHEVLLRGRCQGCQAEAGS
jgi:Fur family ferric uptake transcriptional regulator